MTTRLIDLLRKSELMTTAEVVETQQPTTAMALYSVTPESIATRRDELLALKVNGVDDSTGLTLVKAKLKEVVGWRTGVEAKRKELKAEYIEAGKRVDDVAKVIQSAIAPIENHLNGQKKIVDDELARIELEKKQAIIRTRLARHREAGGLDIGGELLGSLSEPAFEVHLENVRAAAAARQEAERQRQEQEAERKRQAAEEAERNRVEKERLDAERADLQRQREEADRQRQQIEADRQELERQRVANEQMASPPVLPDPIPAPVQSVSAFTSTGSPAVAVKSGRNLIRKRLLYQFACSVRLMRVPKVGDDAEFRVNELLFHCSDAILKISEEFA